MVNLQIALDFLWCAENSRKMTRTAAMRLVVEGHIVLAMSLKRISKTREESRLLTYKDGSDISQATPSASDVLPACGGARLTFVISSDYTSHVGESQLRTILGPKLNLYHGMRLLIIKTVGS